MPDPTSVPNLSSAFESLREKHKESPVLSDAFRNVSQWHEEQESLHESQQEVNRQAAELARDAIESGRDTDYDYASAMTFQNMTGSTMYDDKSQHWYSRIPRGPMEGRLLKSPEHESYGVMIEEELSQGNVIIRKGDHEYSVTPQEAEKYYREQFTSKEAEGIPLLGLGEYVDVTDEDALTGILSSLTPEQNLRNIAETGSATGEWGGYLADETWTESTWGKRTYLDKRTEELQKKYARGRNIANLFVAPAMERLGEVGSYVVGDTVAGIIGSGYTGLMKSISEQLAVHTDYWIQGGQWTDEGMAGNLKEWSEWWSGLNMGLNESLQAEGWVEEKTEMLTHSLFASASGLVAGGATALITRNPALSIRTGLAVSTASALSAGAGAAETRMDMLEEEVNASLRLQGLEANYRIPQAERNRMILEHGVAEAGFELAGNVVGLGIIGKGLKTAGGKLLKPVSMTSPSGRLAISQRMRNALITQVNAKTTTGWIARMAPAYAGGIVTEGLTEVATEIAQTGSISRIDERAWEHMDLWGTMLDGMLLGFVMGSPMTVAQYAKQKSDRAGDVAVLNHKLALAESKRDDTVEHWRRHHDEEVDLVESLTPEDRAQRAKDAEANIQSAEEEIYRIEKEIAALEALADSDPLTVARKVQERREAMTELGRLEVQLALITDVQLGHNEKIDAKRSTPKKVIRARKRTKGNEKIKISKAENKHEKKAEKVMNEAGYEVVWVEGGKEEIPAFYDPATPSTIYLKKDNATHSSNFIAVALHEAVHDIQYYDPVLYKSLKDALGDGEILLSAAEYLAGEGTKGVEDEVGTALLIHLAKGGTLENFEGDVETARTYLEQEGVAVAVQQGQGGRLSKLLQRFGMGSTRGSSNSMLLNALQKSAKRTAARRAEGAELEVSEFGVRRERQRKAAIRQASDAKKAFEKAEVLPSEEVPTPTTLEARKLKKKAKKKVSVAPPPKFETVEELFETPEQQITSVGTIVGGKKDSDYLPALFNNKNFEVPKGSIVANMYAGTSDAAKRKLEGEGAKKVYNHDPFARSEKENKLFVDKVSNGRADIAVGANGLNVIQERENRLRSIAQMANVLKSDGTAYFTVHVGDASGKGKATTRGWQENRKTESYIPEIEEFFGSVERKGKLIIATEPSMEARKLDVQAAAQASLQGKLQIDSPVEYLKQVALKNEAELLASISPKDFSIPKGEVGYVEVYKIPAMEVGYALRKTEDGYEITGVYNNEPNVVEIMQSIQAHAEEVAGGAAVTLEGVSPKEAASFKLHTEGDVIYSLEEMKRNVRKDTEGKGARALGKMLSAVNLLPKKGYYDNLKKVEELEDKIPEIVESLKRVEEKLIMHKHLQSTEGKDSERTKNAGAQLKKERDNLNKLRDELWTDEINTAYDTAISVRRDAMESVLGVPLELPKGKAFIRGVPRKNQLRNMRFLARLNSYAQSILGIVDESNTPEFVEKVMANSLVEELIWASKHDPDFGQNWYKDKIDGMWRYVGKLEPTLLDRDTEQGIHFSLLVSILSDGEKVKNNLRISLGVYRHYNRTGTYKTGTKLRSADYGKLEALRDYFGSWKAVDAWLQKKSTVGEINAEIAEMAKEDKRFKEMQIKGEAVDATGWNSYILGPKLGAFYLNNRGNYEPLTQDVWFTRTIYRLMGLMTEQESPTDRNNIRKLTELVSLIEDGKPLSTETGSVFGPKKREAIGKALAGIKKSDWGTDAVAGFHPSMLEDVKTLEAWVDTTEAKMKKAGYPHSEVSATKDFRAKVEAGEAKYIPHSQKVFQLIANSFKKSGSKGQEDARTTASRKRARRVVREAIEIYKRRTKKTDINNASAQAMLWYMEKELFSIYTGSETPFGQDYETAAKALHDEEVLGRTSSPMEARELDPLGADFVHPKVASLFKGLNDLPKKRWDVAPVELKFDSLPIVELVYKDNTTIQLSAGDSSDSIDPSQPWIMLRGIESKAKNMGTARASLTELMPLLDKHGVGIEVMNRPAEELVEPMAGMYRSLGFRGDIHFLTRSADGAMEARELDTYLGRPKTGIYQEIDGVFPQLFYKENLGPASLYPKIVNVLAAIRQPKMKGNELRKYLSGKGITKEEMFFTGIDEFIEEQGDASIAIEDVQAAVQVIELTEETSAGGEAVYTSYVPPYFPVLQDEKDWVGDTAAMEGYREIVLRWVPKEGQLTTTDETVIQQNPSAAHSVRQLMFLIPEGRHILDLLADVASFRIDESQPLRGISDSTIAHLYLLANIEKYDLSTPIEEADTHQSGEETVDAMIEGIRYQIAEDAKGMTQAEAKAYVTDLFNKVGENIVAGVYPSVDDIVPLTQTVTPEEIRRRLHAFKSFEKVAGVAPTTQNNDAVLRYWRNLPNEVFMGNPTEEAALSIARGALAKKEAEIFQSPHWWGEAGKGNIAHIRAGTWTNPADKKKYLFVIEVQSDWANRALGEGGFQTGEVIPEELLGDAPVPKDRFKLVPEQEGLTEPMREGQVIRRMESGVLYEYTSPDGVVEEFTISSRTHRQYLNKEYVDGILNIDTSWDLFKHKKVLESKRTPRAPFVSTPAGKVSDAWMGVALKRILAEAASEGLDGVVITTKDFANTTRGIQLGEDYVGYSKMATMLRKIGKKVDPDATFIPDVKEAEIERRISNLSDDAWLISGERYSKETVDIVNSEMTSEEKVSRLKVIEGLRYYVRRNEERGADIYPSGAALQITDKMRDAVAQGMPMFGNTTMEARRDLGIRMNETSSKLRIGGSVAPHLLPWRIAQAEDGRWELLERDGRIGDEFHLVVTFDTEAEAQKHADIHNADDVRTPARQGGGGAHTVLADVIDTLPIQEYVEAGKLTWLRGYWDEELDPLVRDYVHSLERAYNEWYIKDQQKKAEQPPVEGMVPTFAMEEEATWEVPDNPWREVAELFEDGPNRDATPIMTLLKLGRKIRFMYENLSDTMTISAQEVLADRAGFTLASLAEIVYNPYMPDDMVAEVDMEYLEEAARRAEGQEDRRLVLQPSHDTLSTDIESLLAGEKVVARRPREVSGVALPMRVDKDVNPYAPMEAFQKASRTMFDSPDVDITKTGDQLWEDTLGFSYEDRPKSMKVDSVLVEGWDIPNVEANAAWLVRYRKGGKHVGTILHLTPAGGFRNAQTVEAKTYKKLSESVLDIVRDISFPLTQEEAAGLTYGEIFNQDTQMHARRLDGSKRMVSVTGVHPPHLKNLVMDVGAVVMPSVATVHTRRELPFFDDWTFGDVFLVWDPDAVRPETAPTYVGDAYTVPFPRIIEQDGKKVVAIEDEDGTSPQSIRREPSGEENLGPATPENIQAIMKRRQEERGGIVSAEIDEFTGAATGVVRTLVLDKLETTEQMRAELAERQGDTDDTFREHQTLWNNVVHEYRNPRNRYRGKPEDAPMQSVIEEGIYTTSEVYNRKTMDKGDAQVRIYKQIDDFLRTNPKPEGVLYRDYLAQPETVAKLEAALLPELGPDATKLTIEMLQKMSTGATKYFEAKPQEIMKWGKGGVVAVLVPADTSYDMTMVDLEQGSVLENLQEMGVTVKRYANRTDGSLRGVQDAFVSTLDSIEDDVMYARKLPADRTSILNSPAMGMIMRDEFERRGLTPAEQTPFQAGFRAGGRATKKLQAVRDKEERKYAIETERERARAREAQKLRNQRELLERRIERVKRKAADAEILRESAITIVKLLSKKDRGELAVKLGRLTTPKRLTILAERAVELAATSEYKESVRRLRKLKTRFNKRKLGMTNKVKADVLGLIATAEAQAYQSGTKKMLPAKGEKLSPSDAVSRASEIHDKLDKAVELVKEATLEYRASREDRAGRLGKLAGSLIDAVNKHKKRRVGWRGKRADRRSKGWFRRSKTTLSLVEMLTQHASNEDAKAIADLFHYALTDAESAQLSDMRYVLTRLDELAKDAGYNSLDALMDEAGVDDIEAMTKTVDVILGGESTTMTLDELMKLAALDEETVSLIVDEVDDTGAVVKSGTGIQMGVGKAVTPLLEITRAELEAATQQLPKGLRDFVRSGKQLREELRDAAWNAYYQIHGTEPKSVEGHEPRTRERTAGQQQVKLDVASMTASFIDEAGFTKGRVAGGQAVVITGFIDDLIKSTEALSKLAHMAVPIRDAIAVLNQREVRDAINTSLGAQFLQDLEDRLLHGSGMISRTGDISTVISHGVAGSYIAANPQTWGVVLIGGISNLAIQMPVTDVLVGLTSLVNIKKNLQKAWAYSGYLYGRSRSGAMRRQTQEVELTAGRLADQDKIMSSVVKVSKSLARSAQYLLQGDVKGSWGPIKDILKEVYRLPDTLHVLQALDNIVVAVAYGAYESKYHAEGLRGDELARASAVAAERIIRQTQNTSSPLDATVLDAHDAKTGKNWRSLLPFSSDPITKANAVYRAVKYGNKKEKALAVSGYMLQTATVAGWRYGYGVLLLFIAKMFRDDEPDYYEEQKLAIVERAHKKGLKQRAVSNAIEDMLSLLGFQGIVAAWGLSWFEGYEADHPALVVGVAEDISATMNSLVGEATKDDSDEEKVEGYLGRLVELFRVLGGDPTVIPSKHIERVKRLADPTLEDVERAKRKLTKQTPLSRLLGMEAEELSRAEKRALTRLRAKDKRDKAREERLANQPQP